MSRGIDKRCATRQGPTSELAAKAPVKKGNQGGLPLGLPEAARTIQVVDGKAHVKTGPYLTEGVGGYCVLEAENMEAAIELAARIPAARLGGAVEIRPADKYW